MKIKKVTITPGCVSCGSCEVIAPEVFEIKRTAQVKQGAQLQENQKEILEAARMCPVRAIQVQKEE